MKISKVTVFLAVIVYSSLAISQGLSEEDNATWMALKCGSELEDRINPEICAELFDNRSGISSNLDPKNISDKPSEAKISALRDLDMIATSRVCAIEWGGKFVGVENFNSSNGAFELEKEILGHMSKEEYLFHLESFQKRDMENKNATYNFCVNWNNTLLQRH
jgi:hypothetical protein